MTINELKNELGISNTEIAGFFGLTPMAYANSSAKKRYESALCAFYGLILERREGEKENGSENNAYS